MPTLIKYASQLIPTATLSALSSSSIPEERAEDEEEVVIYVTSLMVVVALQDAFNSIITCLRRGNI